MLPTFWPDGYSFISEPLVNFARHPGRSHAHNDTLDTRENGLNAVAGSQALEYFDSDSYVNVRADPLKLLFHKKKNDYLLFVFALI